MRFNINGNIKNAKYCLIYKENYNNYDEPEFLWNNGLIGDIYSYNKKYNTTDSNEKIVIEKEKSTL